MLEVFRPLEKQSAQSGSILTAALGVVVLVGTLSYTAYNLLSGPVRSAAIVTLKTKAQNELMTGAKLIMRAAADDDADLVLEPPAADITVTAVASTNGGGIPTTIGAEKIDPWRTPYAYCGWNHGGTNTGATGLLDGDPASYNGLLAIALISAGPNRTFETVCNNALGTVTTSGDDIVMRYTYEQAVSIELWKESSTPGTIETSNPSQSVGIGKTADPLYKLDVLGNSLMTGNLSVSAAIDANSVTAGTVDINGGTIDGTSIGGAVRSTGAFTTLNANSGTTTLGLAATGTITLNGSGSINGLTIGDSTAATGRFTNLSWTGTMTPPNTTVVTNLNADLLDGQHGAFYQDASNLNAGTLPIARTPAYQGDVAKVQGDDFTFIESFQGYTLKINPAPTADQVMGWDSSNKVWKPMVINIGSGDADTIGVGGVNFLATATNINDANCTDGLIPKFTHGDWYCVADQTGVTSIVLTGDVTGTGSSSIATTIANDVVTFAKMQNIPTASLIGRYTAATGDPQSITLGAGLALSGGGVLSASGVSTGATVSGGNANSVLYLNNSGQLATSPNFTYNTTTNSFMMSINGAGIAVDGANNGSNISINDASKYIIFSPDAKLSLVLDRGAGTYGLGDISNSVNNTIFRMEDATKTISMSTKVNGIATSDVFLADATNGVYRFGDIRGGGGVFMDINGTTGAIAFNVGPAPLVTIGPGLLKLDYLTGTPGMLVTDPFGNVSSTTIPVGVTDGDKGDITVSASGATWTIDNNVVTFAKMQDIATARLVGRTTAGSGDPELITVGSGLTLSAGTLSADAVGVSDGDKGDITVSASGATWTLDNDVVTLAKLQNIATTSLIGRSTAGAGDPEVISIGTGLTLAGGTLSANAAGAPEWGDITGTLSDQTDLQTALDNKVTKNADITGATKTKITYDAKGLVTAGADATTADIADSADRRYVTDAQLAVIGNTSGTNTGDQTITLTGDVTGTGTGSFATTIANDAVSFAKLQNIATDKLLGRSTAGAGDVEEITIGSGLSLAGGTLSASTSAPAWGDITGTLSDQTDLQAALDAKVESVTGLMTDNTDPLNPVIQIAVDGVTITGDGTFADPLVAATSVADGDKGDVTVSASGTTWTVDNDVVSFAKMQNIATDKLLGRSTAGSGDPEEITIGAGLTLAAGTLTASGSGPGGSDTHVQFNDGGSAFGGEANFTWNKAIKRLFVGDVGGGNNTYLDVNDSTKTIDINSNGIIRLGDIANDVNGTIISISDPQSKIFTTRKLEVPDVAYAVGWDNDPSVPTKNAVYDKIETITPFTAEAAQDAVGAMVDTSLVYVDATPLLTRAALTGDVTASQGSNATTIANNAVTFAKMQDIATARLIGRTTAGSGDPELISIGSGLSLAGGILSASSSALSIGDPVASSTANAVLYVDSGNNLGNSSAFTYDGNALIAGNGKNFLNLDHAGQIYKIGDIDGNKNFTHMVIDDGNKAVNLQSSGKQYFLIDVTNGSYKMGDIDGTGAGTALTMDDPNKRISFFSVGGEVLVLDAGNMNYEMGDITGIGAKTILTINDPNKTFKFSDGGNDRYIFEPSSLTVPHLGDGATTRMLTVNKDGVFIPATLPSALTDGDKGDITVSGSGTAWAVDNNVVTFAKMQDITTAHLIGRSTAGSGDPELISIGSGLSLAGGTLSASGGSGTVTSVNITPPAAGITASGGPVTSSGSITLALADDLAAVEGLSTNGMVARTASNTWTTRTITAGDATVSITNGDGVSGNPTISMARTINTQAGTSYTLVIADAQKVVETSNGSAITITIPPNASVAFPVGTFIDFVQYGAGQITLAPGAGVTLRSFASSLKTAGQYAVITAYKRATDEWVITGNTQ